MDDFLRVAPGVFCFLAKALGSGVFLSNPTSLDILIGSVVFSGHPPKVVVFPFGCPFNPANKGQPQKSPHVRLLEFTWSVKIGLKPPLEPLIGSLDWWLDLNPSGGRYVGSYPGTPPHQSKWPITELKNRVLHCCWLFLGVLLCSFVEGGCKHHSLLLPYQGLDR